MRYPPGDICRPRQAGVVLTVVLLILLIVTAVGVSGMNSSSVQLNLARNTHLKHESFQNAESTMVTAEIAWDEKLSNCLNDVGGCTENVTPPVIDNVDAIDWDSVSGEGVTGYGKYIVEYLGWRPVPGDDKKSVHLYRLTARGESRDFTARTLIQTVYQKCVNADGVPCDSQGGN